ncbi:adenylyl-sulfate kinase [Buchnera aphidicola (Muscaphis stroyani)]|uniref:Adenylyl-sulfate kinase n=1 Tax=Buchnera aphidicola (Muscaphis stroyani) TaxID=1241869 RepID=A0A4D6YFN0_9GAMM|nr:adenylyl-sulfate kinase [Buchnera aphidicola]QCI24470.1 adenylyl-sulfate kinase [Buchnera aphidicola (Muscaphis stroyani)]
MNANFDKNVILEKHLITRFKREIKHNHKSIVLWFTGLSGSGKSSISNILEQCLFKKCVHTYILDGDNVRTGLCSDLNFSISDRTENIRRIGEVSKLMLDAGMIVLVAIISPYRYQRKLIRKMLGESNFLEIFVDTPIQVCENRDPKNLYKKARKGEIFNFTGIQSEYQIPEKPDVHLDGTQSLKDNAKKLIKILYDRNIIPFFNIC